MEDKKIIIKKYENRRLYDSTRSRYVNLEEVAAMVREGLELQVIDAKTGEDITGLILTQIIVENAKEREFALPIDILRQLVIASSRVGQEALAQYMRAMTDFYQAAYKGYPLPAAPFDYMRSMLNPAAAPWLFGMPPRPGADSKTAPPQPEPATKPSQTERSQPDIERLLKRLEELERRLTEKEASPRAKRTQKRS